MHTTPSESQIAFFAGLWRICHHPVATGQPGVNAVQFPQLTAFEYLE